MPTPALARFMSDMELSRFIAAVRTRNHTHQPRDLAMFMLLATVGMRPSEVLAMAPEDFRLHGAAPWIRIARMKKRLKARQFDEMEIPAELARVVAAYVDGKPAGAPVFGMHRRQAQRLFRYYAKLSGARPSLSLYCLRHTAATRILRVTKSIEVVQAVLGHERPDVSCIYAHITRRMIREGLASMPAVV